MIHRRQQFRAEPHIVEKVKKLENVELVLDSVVEEFIGDQSLAKMRIRNVKTGQERIIEVSGCFEYVGQIPATDFVKELGITMRLVIFKLIITLKPKLKTYMRVEMLL